MNKLSIAINIGAKNNGIFVIKSCNNKIIDKKAAYITIDKNSINFSKKSRRENRHKNRNNKRKKLAKTLLKELINFSKYDKDQQEKLLGLLNNRGYTFISTKVEFKCLNEQSVNFNKKYLKGISSLKTKEEFEEYFANEFEDECSLLQFLKKYSELIIKYLNDLGNFLKKRKILKDLEAIKSNNIPKKFQNFSYVKHILHKYNYIGKNEKEIMINLTREDFDNSNIDFEKELNYINNLNFTGLDKNNIKYIQADLKKLLDFFVNIYKEIETGSKPRKKYLKEIKNEIRTFHFIQEKEKLYNLVGNISNMQLKVLRKFFNYSSFHKDRFKILDRYFKAFHYNSDDEKIRKKELFKYLKQYTNFEDFLKNTNPILTIPPYEDMNNRNTYKCNTMLINPSKITDDLKVAIDEILKNEYFSSLLISNEGEFKKEKEFRVKPKTNNKYEKIDFTYSKYLQRILDARSNITTKELNPRNVFKYKKVINEKNISAVEEFKKVFGEKIYFTLEKFALRYYKEEELIKNGLYEESNSVFIKCNSNTPHKNNAKHIMLKPLYSYNFTPEESESFINNIVKTRGLKGFLQLISEEAKKYQNSFCNVLISCYQNEKYIDDKNIKKIVNNLPKTLDLIKNILHKLNIDQSIFEDIEKIDITNIKRIVNIFKQTYEILFKQLSGFNKTCKHCTRENAIRSDKKFVLCRKLLSDITKPFDGMLDMILDRVSYEIISFIDEKKLDDIDLIEIILKQNKIEFEMNLNEIKRYNNPLIKKYSIENENRLKSNYCPYTGKRFEIGDYDFILNQEDNFNKSKANIIYASIEGIASKQNKNYRLEDLNIEHLRDIFKTSNINEIIKKIRKGLFSINKDEFKNFDNLNISQQIAVRYALFMRDSLEFEKAFEIIKMDKLKTIINGKQKRVSKIIYKKLLQNYFDKMERIEVNVKAIDNELVGATRNLLALSNESLRKEKDQKKHSHCIDAMVAFYLSNLEIEPTFDFNDIYSNESLIRNVSKNKTFINSTFKERRSIPLFKETIYAENFYIIEKKKDKFYSKGKELKGKNVKLLVEHKILYKNIKNKKYFFNNIKEIKICDKCKIDISKLSNLLYIFFINKDKNSIDQLKFLDNLRYNTIRKDIANIFFDDKGTKLLDFEKVKDIPPFSKNLFKAVYKKLKNTPNLFRINSDNNQFLNYDILENILKNMFESKQKEDNKQKRKRAKKKEKYTLPCLGKNAQYKVKRGDVWQILGGKKIATKSYIINNDIKPIPYFTKNVLPLKICDLSNCLLLERDAKPIYEVSVDMSNFKEIKELTYFITEASRYTVKVVFNKKYFSDIQFDKIKTFDCAKDEIFKNFVDNYIESNLEYTNYINSMRNNKFDKKGDGENKELKAVATLLTNNKTEISLLYKVEKNNFKKQVILDTFYKNKREI